MSFRGSSLDGREAGDGVAGDEIGDAFGGVEAVGPEPVGGPVERAEEGARRDRGVGGAERAGCHALRDQGADAALVAIPLGDDDVAEAAGQGVDLEMRGRPFHFVDQAAHVRGGEIAETRRQRAPIAPRRRQRAQQTIERAILAEEQELVLAAEVVIEVAVGQVGGDGDLAHPGGGEAALPEDPGGRLEDVDAARFSSSGTPVRKLTHGSILALAAGRDRRGAGGFSRA